jgi:hypothetical protein
MASNIAALKVRPIKKSDVEQLDLFRWKYEPADLEVPKGYMAEGVESAVVEKPSGQLVGSLTGTLAAVLDPFIANPDADPVDIWQALILLEKALAYRFQVAGAVDIYIAVPNQLEKYHRLLERAGYLETVQNCKVFRKPLAPDTHPLLGEIRDGLAKQAAEDSGTINTTGEGDAIEAA